MMESLKANELAKAQTSEYFGRDDEIGIEFTVRLSTHHSMGAIVSVDAARALAFKLLDTAYEAERRMV